MSLDSTAAAGWLMHCAVGGGFLLLLTCLLIRHTRQPARRQRLGELGLAAALVLAVLSLRPPWLVLAWPLGGAPPPPLAHADAAPPEEVMPGEDLVLAWPAPPGEAILGPPAKEEAPPEDAAVPEAASSWWQAALWLLPWLVAAHALCAAVLLSRWLLGHYALARLLRGAVPAPAEVAALFQRMAPRRLKARLLVARRLRVPLSFGLLRPTVVLPAALCAAPDLQRLRWVFAHELTHLERRDAWSALLFALGQAVYFFLPWFRWLRRQVRLCQEYVADAAAAGQEGPAVDYAEFLLSLSGAPSVPAATSGVSGNCSDLYRRVTMLLKEPLRVEKRCPRRWSLAAAGGLFALAIVVGGVGVRADAAPQVVIIIPAQDAKPGQSEPEKKVRVLVAPGLDGLPTVKRVAPQGGGREKVLIRQRVLTDKPDGVKVYKELHLQPKWERGQAEWRLRVHPDVRYEEVLKILRRIEQKPGAVQIEAVRDDLHKLVGQLSQQPGFRPIQGQDKVLILKRKGTDFRPGKHTEAVLEALRKALEQLGKQPAQPDLDGARQQLKRAIESLERAGLGNLGYYAPSKALVVPALPKGGQPPAAPPFDSTANFRYHYVPFTAGKPVDPELLKQVREALKKQNYARAEELLKKALEEANRMRVRIELKPAEGPRDEAWVRYRVSGPARLGVTVEKPSAALADQLNLPADKGLIITAVKAASSAAKAGLKVNDVLLELNGKPVASDAAALARILDTQKPGASLTAVVLRKGKREAIKGIGLPGNPGAGGFQPWLQLPGGKGKPGDHGDVLTTVLRARDRFTTRYQEGSLIITLTGTTAGGKTKVGEIHIQDGQQTTRYDSVERVPAQYRDKVIRLVEMSGQGEMRIQGNRP